MLKEQIDSKNYLDPVLYAYHLKRYQFARQFVKGMTVLDSGCGEGYGSCLLSEDATCVYGIDKDKIVIEQANQRYANAEVCFLAMDVVRTDFPIAMFDVVVSFEILEHLPDHHAYLSEVVRLLKPSGLFICSTPNRIVEELHMKSIGMDYPYHISLVDEKTFRKELERHFQVIRIYGMRRRGNWVYNTLRSLDYFNLRLRCVPYAVRTRIQSAAVDNGPQVAPFEEDNIVISLRQLRQSNTLLAVCRRPSEVACEVSRDSESPQGESIKVGARSGRNPQKVLFVHCQSEIGGAETLLLSTLKYLNRERYHPFVFCFGRDDDPLPVRLRELRVDHQLIVPHRLRKLGTTVRVLQDLMRFVHKEDVAVVIAYSLYPYIYGGLLAALTGKKGICYVMDAVIPKWWRNGLVKTISVMIGHRCLLADSNYVRENLLKAFPWVKSVKTVYHGIDQSCFDPALYYNAMEVRQELQIPIEAPIVTIVGRLQTWKGQHVFIKAAELVRRIQPQAKFLIVGGTINRIEPGYAEYLRCQVKDFDLRGSVHFLGHRDDVPAIMSASDVIVHASIEPEPFGCVIAEGMAMKRPVVATNIGGPPEIIVHGETGLLIPPNDPKAMAGAIQALLRDPELRLKMGEKGRRRVDEHFTAERMTRDIEAAIEGCLKS